MGSVVPQLIFMGMPILKSFRKEIDMNDDIIKGNWKQFTGKVKENWGKLTNDDLDIIDGKREQLVGKIQERFGVARDEADKQVKHWETQHGYQWE